MIPASRFLVQSRHRDKWLAARAEGVTATAVAHAATPSGFTQEVNSWSEPAFEGNEFTEFGNWAEPYLLEHAHREFGILPNDFLIAGEDPRWLATPDGLSLDHTLIAEAKTTGKDWVTPPIQYVRQIQWQLLVTGAERCLLLWQQRLTAVDGSFYMAWFEPKTLWVDPNPRMQADLVEVAEKLWEARRGELQPR